MLSYHVVAYCTYKVCAIQCTVMYYIDVLYYTWSQMKPIEARSSVAKQVRRGPRSVRVSKVIKLWVLVFVPLFAFALRTLSSGEWHRACYACVSHLHFSCICPSPGYTITSGWLIGILARVERVFYQYPTTRKQVWISSNVRLSGRLINLGDRTKVLYLTHCRSFKRK